MTKRLLLVLRIMIVGLVLLGTTSLATAYSLTVTNDPSVGPSDGTVTYGTVTVSVAGHVATFIVDVNQDYLTPGSPQYGVDTFYFNSSIKDSLSASDFSLPTGWEVDIATPPPPGAAFNVSQYGKFMIKITDPPRLDPLEFTITDNDITSADQFYFANLSGYHYAAHIAGFSLDNGSTASSAWFADGTPTNPVPEPSTMLLLGCGLIGLSAFGRRKLLHKLPK